MADTNISYGHCEQCLIVAPFDQLVQADGWWCPTCAPPTSQFDWRLVKELGSELLFLLTAGVIYAFGTYDLSLEPIQVFIIGFGVYLALTIIHEGGHALMAKLTGRDLVGVVIGHGHHRLARAKIRGVLFELRANLTGGSTFAADTAGTSSRAGSALFTLGGIIAEAVVVIAAWFWNAGDSAFDLARFAIIVFGTYDIVMNLVPQMVNMAPHGSIPNDGKLLVALLRREPKAETALDLNAQDYVFQLFLETATLDEAGELAASNFLDDPTREINRFRHGLFLVARQEWADAVAILQPLESWTQLDDDKRAHLVNDMAWSALMTFDDSLLGAANRWSEEAHELRPVVPAYSSTRGSALVMAGRAEEGLPLLLRAYRTARLAGFGEPELALVAGFAAVGAASLPDRVQALERYRDMVKHDPACKIRHQVERRIGEPEVAEFATMLDGKNGLDTSSLSPELRELVPYQAMLVLNWLNGADNTTRVVDEYEVILNHGSVAASDVRAAARNEVAKLVADEIADVAHANEHEHAAERLLHSLARLHNTL